MRATLEGRWHDASVSAGSWTATSEARAPGRWHPTARGRWSQFRSDRGHSELVSLALEVQPWGLATMACSGGTRTTTDRVAEVSDRVEWIEGQLDVAIGRGFAAATFTEERGAIERLRGMYGSVGWRW